MNIIFNDFNSISDKNTFSVERSHKLTDNIEEKKNSEKDILVELKKSLVRKILLDKAYVYCGIERKCYVDYNKENISKNREFRGRVNEREFLYK
jgi:hypothetical protein